ncbi:MAG: ABC transporter permease [Vicinamibacterales bacterium]
MSRDVTGRGVLVVRLARAVAGVIVRTYPRALRARRADVLTFTDDAIDAAWHDHGALRVAGVVLRLAGDVLRTRWRGAALPVTSHAGPVAGRAEAGAPPRGSRRVGASFAQDLRHEVRGLGRTPAFTLAAVATLAIGLGASTAIFTIVNGVLLRPLPYGDPGSLVRVATEWNNFGQGSISDPEFLDLVDRSTTFASIGLYRHTSVNITDGEGEPERTTAALVTPDLFRTLRVVPETGQLFPEDAGREGAEAVVLLSDGLWRDRFGADPTVVGRSLRLRGASYRVVGVMPAGFDFPNAQIRLWLPMQPDRSSAGSRGSHSSLIIGRLAAAVPAAQAQAELDRISADLRREFAQSYTADSGFHFVARPYLDVVTGGVRPALLLLLAAASLVLLIACVNVANLVLARSAERQRQIALRAALGASTGRLVRQLVTGSLLLSAAGGLGGLAVAGLAVRFILAMPAANLPRAQTIGLDGTVFAFNGLLVVITGLVVGLLPARRSARASLAGTLKEGGRAGGGSARRRTRSALVVAEVALATVLLVGAGLLVRSVGRMLAVDPGFRADQVITGRLTLDPSRYGDDAARRRFFDDVVTRLESRSDIEAAGIITILPLSNYTSDQWVAPSDHPFDGDSRFFLQYRLVTPGYFDAMRIPVVRGRNFSAADTESAPPVALVSASLARRFWGDADPIGRRIGTGPEDLFTVVGVVGDVHHQGLAEGETPIWYRPYAQAGTWPDMTLVARTTGATDPAPIGEMVRAIDPLQPVYDARPMSAWTERSISADRFNSTLLALLATLAVALAGVGLYAVISYSVSLRTQEIGIRMALGADRWQVWRLVVGQGLVITGAGVAVGIALAIWLSRLIASRLYGVTATDVPTYAGAAALLLLVALAADLAPAIRATRVDPIIALRRE